MAQSLLGFSRCCEVAVQCWSLAREVVSQPRVPVDRSGLAELYGHLPWDKVGSVRPPEEDTEYTPSPRWSAAPSCALGLWGAQPSLGSPRLLDMPSMCGRAWVCDWASPHSQSSTRGSLGP